MRILFLFLFFFSPLANITLDPFQFFVYTLSCFIVGFVQSGCKFIKSSIVWFSIFSILAAGLASYDQNNYLVLKGLGYALSPFLYTLIGMYLFRIVKIAIINNWFVFWGIFFSLLTIILGIANFGMTYFADPSRLREFYLWPVSFPIVAFIIFLFKSENPVPGRKFWALLCALAVFLASSRTYIILFLLTFAVFLYLQKKTVFYVFFLILGFFLIFVLGKITTSNQLLVKFQRSSEEVKFKDYKSDKEINTNYRGFESARALFTYLDGSYLNLIFGHGLGKNIDLGVKVKLGENYLSEVPIIHNGYLLLLVKQGFLGVLIFAVFFLSLLGKAPNFGVFEYGLVYSSIIALLISNIVISSFFSKEMFNIWILLGYLYRYKNHNLIAHKAT